ncbi:glycine betaine ABC transporter substrate-binding protein [Demequina sp. TTPB684]|uniref:glycine betaine ABC transporter substrate-binding protein n=1 Tax=unclassified Demequina TaxID=2620311 RepID=UPI001CF1F043|nr:MULTISPECIES: glycine betaine ABC transporter substrate-binding protein [unclassified Demequina]MCB2411951.1 glycine betaine ABC transporter substrate-binding protein [Demequina sp. TTPB684]UPU87151.1 glycine betaine ABC transporter substrate-binding protein [Demequina sp. TMPB413]
MKMRSTALLATAAAASLVLAGCSSEEADPTTPATGGEDAPAAGGDITMAVFNGWDESLASSLLWQQILEDKGYNVTLEYADPAPVFQAVADGDYDLVTDVWLPATHADYLDEFGDDIEEVGAWFDSAALTVAVNADAPIDSLAELSDPAVAAEFDNRIVGIEPGAGLTGAVQDNVIPTYGLEDMEFLTSSTPAMLAELDSAMADGENIIVTLWEPHWAYGAYDLKNLEDPEGTLGDAESIYTYSRTGFATDFPEVAEWMGNFTMSSDLLYDLENQLQAAEGESDYDRIVSDWIAANQEWVDSLTA